MNITITGAEEFAVLSRALKQAGAKDLQRELSKSINRTVKPLTQDVKQNVGRFVPGRYAAVLAPSLRITTSRRGSGRNPGVRLKAKATTGRGKPRELKRLDAGQLRHPLFGNRRHWFSQTVRPGFYTETLEQDAPTVRRELLEAIRIVAAKIDRVV